jgi:hypothetical protein
MMDPEDHLRAEWPEVRRRGRSRFIWRERVLLFGLPIGVFDTWWSFHTLGWGLAELITLRGVSLAYFVLAVSAGAAALYARAEWDDRERRYHHDRGLPWSEDDHGPSGP